MSIKPLLEIQNLSFTYPTKFREKNNPVLKGVSLKVFPGEIYGILGPNGAGKTTTIKMTIGAIPVQNAHVKIFGKVNYGNIPGMVGYVPEDYDLPGFLTVERFLEKMTELAGNQKDYRVDKVFSGLDIFSLLNRRIGDLSRGQKQRVILAQAFLLDPPLYIFDEPTSGLDPVMTLSFNELLKREAEKGKGIFLSSHRLSEVEKSCHRVGFINGGMIILEGEPEKLIEEKELSSLEELFFHIFKPSQVDIH
jgi:ABC-2 type transport system ATP-binding protein